MTLCAAAANRSCRPTAAIASSIHARSNGWANFSMRCPEALFRAAAAVALAASCGAFAAADQVKAGVAARLQQQVPGISAADYALGAAALDNELRSKMQENAAASAPVIEAGKKLFGRKFGNGRTPAACFPNGGGGPPPPPPPKYPPPQSGGEPPEWGDPVPQGERGGALPTA